MQNQDKKSVDAEVSVHLYWVITCVLAIICFLMIRVPDGSIIRDFISFSASIASLILAVVAIFYAFISNRGFSDLIGSLRESAVKIEQASTAVSNSAEVVSNESKLLTEQIIEIPIAMRSLSEKIERQSVQTTTESMPVAETVPLPGLIRPSPSTEGTDAALYLCVKSFQLSMPFSTAEMFKAEPYTRGFMGGTIYAFKVSKFADMEITRDVKFLQCIDIGTLDVDYIVSEMNSQKSYRVKMKKNIDDYFEELGQK